MIAPEWVAVSSFGRRRSLSDLAVWGFPEFSRKIFPLKPFPPFLPFFSPLLPSSNSSDPQTPPSNSLEQVFISPFYPLLPLFLPLGSFLQFLHPSKPSLQLSSSSLYQPLLPLPSFFSSKPLPTLSSPLSDLLRTPPESLHRVPQKAQNSPF